MCLEVLQHYAPGAEEPSIQFRGTQLYELSLASFLESMVLDLTEDHCWQVSQTMHPSLSNKHSIDQITAMYVRVGEGDRG